MGITIAELAKEIGVSKVAIHKRINQEPLKSQLVKSLTKDGNKFTIDKRGQRLIAKAFEPDKRIQNVERNEYQNDLGNSGILKVLQAQLDLLQGQLESKDKQIDNLTRTIDNLNERLAESQRLNQNQQELTLVSSKQNQLLIESSSAGFKLGNLNLFKKKDVS